MKEKIHIKITSHLTSILGLAFLLLLSPCKVRNSIQQDLGIPQTEVANKSKATISHSTCSTFESVTSTFAQTKTFPQNFPAFPADLFSFNFNISDLANKSDYALKERNHAVSLIPLYILYQNLKAYL